MANFFSIIKNNCVNDNQGKFFYFLTLILIFLFCMLCLSIFLISTINPNIFFIDRENFDTTILNLESRYTPDKNVKFYESSFYRHYLVYNSSNGNLRVNINIADKFSIYPKHNIDYIFQYGKLDIKYTYLEGSKEIFNAEVIKKNNEFYILEKSKKKLNDEQIAMTTEMLETSITAFDHNALSSFNFAISEYIEFQNTLNITFAVSLTFFIFLLLVCVSMIVLFVLAYNRPDIDEGKAVAKLTSDTIEILKKYKELLNNKIISEEEFKIIKSKLLNL